MIHRLVIKGSKPPGVSTHVIEQDREGYTSESDSHSIATSADENTEGNKSKDTCDSIRNSGYTNESDSVATEIEEDRESVGANTDILNTEMATQENTDARIVNGVNDMRLFGDMREVLPKFDPIKDNIDIKSWIAKIDEYANIYSWDDIAKVHYAIANLTGVAQKWRDSLPSMQRTWSEWKVLLIEAFPCETSYMKKRLQAQHYVRRQEQDVTEYYYEKLARCNRAGMSNEESVEWIISGLNNVRFRDYLGPFSRYPSPSTLLPDLRSANHLFQERTSHSKSSKDKDRDKEKSTKPKLCFNCKEEGRGANRCTKPRSNICFLCNKPGHYAKYCKNKTADGAAKGPSAEDVGQVLRIEMTQNHSKYFKEAYINGHYTKCYVNLGSSCIALRKDAVDKMGLTYLEGSFDRLVGYGARSVTPIGMLTATIAIDGVEARARIHVVPSECQIIPLIVGHPYTEQHHVEIISRSNELVIQRVDNRSLNAVPEENDKTRLWAEKAVVIPNNYIGYVAVQTALQNQDICLEGGMREDGQLIPRCLVKTNGTGISVVPVLNVTGSKLSIDEGAVIARGETITLGNGNPKQIKYTESVRLEEVNTDLPREQAEEIVSILNSFKELVARDIFGR